jgi:Phage terminase large subunit
LSILKIPTAKVFEPLLKPCRYKGIWGGRGSGKSHFFGEMLVETCQAERGMLAVCIREAQKTLAQSSKRLIESKIGALGLGHGFKSFSDRIETPGDGMVIFRGMQDHTSESIKSLEGFRIAWIDEAQTLSARSLSLLRPTIRAERSELWASWNPRRKSDAIDDFFRRREPQGAVVVKANWRDNPWFPAVLEDERRLDLSLYPEMRLKQDIEPVGTLFDGTPVYGFRAGLSYRPDGAGRGKNQSQRGDRDQRLQGGELSRRHRSLSQTEIAPLDGFVRRIFRSAGVRCERRLARPADVAATATRPISAGRGLRSAAASTIGTDTPVDAIPDAELSTNAHCRVDAWARSGMAIHRAGADRSASVSRQVRIRIASGGD